MSVSTVSAVSASINVKNFLRWESISIYINNPSLDRATCMKLALKNLCEEKKYRAFIRTKSQEIKKINPQYTLTACMKLTVKEWKENKSGRA